MKCPRCQAEHKADARFCEDCGARLDAACPSCGTPATPSKNFCRSCGTALTTAKILASESALEGEHKQVTVRLADLRGSMELLTDRNPEDARKILDPVLELMMEASLVGRHDPSPIG